MPSLAHRLSRVVRRVPGVAVLPLLAPVLSPLLAACSRASGDPAEASAAAVVGGASAALLGVGGACVVVLDGDTSNGAALALGTCDAQPDQAWTFGDDGTVVGPAGKCLDVAGAQTGNGIETYLWACNGQVNQTWTMRGQELLSWDGRCLDTAGESPAAGATLQVSACTGAASQQWAFEVPEATGCAGDAGPDGNGVPLDAGSPVDGSMPTPSDGGSATGMVPGDGKGTTALRIADLMERFGANVYSNGQDGASGETVDGITKASQYLTGGSGLTMGYRGYVNSASDYDTFGPQLFAASGGKFTLCMGIGDTPNPGPVVTLAQAAASQGNWIQFIEGGNEPNTNFGVYQGGVSASTELAAMQTIYAGVKPTGIPVAAASVVGSADGITQYWGSDLAGAVAATDRYNTHLYPNNGGPNGANQLHDWSGGVQSIWGNKHGIISEYQPVLYNNKATDDASAAYWTPIMLLSSYVDFQVEGVFWWGLFDYAGFTPHVGLFRDNVANPYPAAMALKAMYGLTGDTGASKHTFTPGQLDVTVSGLPGGQNAYDGGRSAVFQSSSGEYFLFVWNEQDALATGTSSHITVTFNSAAMSKVVDYSLTNPASATPAPKQTLTDVKQVQLDLTTEVRLLQITHP